MRDVLLKLGQGRAVSEGLLNLACVYIFGSHGHHLRRVILLPHHAPGGAAWPGRNGPYVTGLLSVSLLAA